MRKMMGVAAVLWGLGVAAAGCATTKGSGDETQVRLDGLPQTMDEFAGMRDAMAVHPEGGAAYMVLAGLMYAQDETLGLQAITSMMEGDKLTGPAVYKDKGLPAEQVTRLSERWGSPGGKAYVPRSYVQDTHQDDGYVLPQPPYVVKVRLSQQDKGVAKVLVWSTGAQTPRPLTLVKDDAGVWKVRDFQALLQDVKPPKETKPKAAE